MEADGTFFAHACGAGGEVSGGGLLGVRGGANPAPGMELG